MQNDLCENPDALIEAYCNRLEIPHIPSSTNWTPREIPEWKTWERWHLDAKESTGIKK